MRVFDCILLYAHYLSVMAEPTTEEQIRELTLNLGTTGTAFAMGMLTGVVAGVVAVIVLLNYTKK